MSERIAVVFGAGPAGLTAAYELVEKTDVKPIVYEMTDDVGGISKTAEYKGNRIDIGGHRFFSKSERIMRWWQNILPLQGSPSKDDNMLGRVIPAVSGGPDPEKEDTVMLFRSRLSRILYLRKFFDYPMSLNLETITNLGIPRIIKIGLSYVKARAAPIKPEKSLEDFFVNRFGRQLYETFFEDYTEKVWGVPCSKINPEWGAQRIKGLSLTKTILHALKPKDSSISQKEIETSLIGQFMYPKYGPGQMWEEVSGLVRERGGEIVKNHRVVGVSVEDGRVVSVDVKDERTGETQTQEGDFFFSTMPVKDLIQAMGDSVPEDVSEVAEGLVYRDFMTLGLLLKKLKVKNKSDTPSVNDIIPDNWIYVQERDVKLGRIQVFNNWSPYLVKDFENTVWIGLEYFVNEGDKMWTMPDTEFSEFAVDELVKVGFIEREDVLDSVAIRVPKTYPAYFGTYDRFEKIIDFTKQIENLYLIGRNGMHRYNNMDHSMLTAITAVENIAEDIKDKDNIWAVNAEKDYHEQK